MFGLTIAGGRGERLKPFTDSAPKSMAPVNDRPLLEYQVEWMRLQGVTDVVFLCGYMWEKIEAHFGDGSRFGVRAHYSVEETPLGRGGAVRKGMSLIPPDDELAIVMNGDVLTGQPASDLLRLHRERRAVATMMLVPYPSQYGVVSVNGHSLVTEFAEKASLPFWINAGVYVFDRQVEALLPKVGDHETTTFPQLAAEGKLAALKSNAVWRSVEGAKDLRECGDLVRRGALKMTA